MQRGRHLFTEERVQAILANYFASKGYRVIEGCITKSLWNDPTQFPDITKCRTHDIQGIDVVAQNSMELWVNEAKGETEGGLAACTSSFLQGIGQIIMRVAPKSFSNYRSRINYALAIPNTDYFATSARKFINSSALPLLNLKIILVQEDGNVEFLG